MTGEESHGDHIDFHQFYNILDSVPYNHPPSTHSLFVGFSECIRANIMNI